MNAHGRVSAFPLLLLLLLLLAAAARCAPPQFDLYLDADDSLALIGLPARLYYVRGGRPCANAVRYAAEVPSSARAVNVTWTSRTQLSHYRLSARADRAAVTPALSVPPEGPVPDGRSAFSVSLPCAYSSAGAVDVRLSVRVWSSGPEAVDVALLFRKSCADRPPTDPSPPQTPSSSPPPPPPPPYYERALYRHAVSVASALAALAVACCLTASRYARRDEALAMMKGFRNGGGAFSRSAAAGCPGKAAPKDLHECVAELSVPRHRIRLRSVELEGTFGRVWRGLCDEDEVFVKTVTDQASAVQISVLLREGLSMYGLSHRNVVTVRAVSVEHHAEPLLLYACDNGRNLKKFLHGCRSAENFSCALTTREIIAMTVQIVDGMRYMHKNGRLHGDLAARNCLVDPEELRVRIADNALSRDLFPGDYHCLGDNKNRPIKWMAVESLDRRKFSTATDVWSFGVLLWELLTLCQQPYADVDPFEISAYLQDGFRLNQPVNCPDELFTVMACCWALAPNERPTFSQLSVFLNEFNNQLVKFV